MSQNFSVFYYFLDLTIMHTTRLSEPLPCQLFTNPLVLYPGRSASAHLPAGLPHFQIATAVRACQNYAGSPTLPT